MVNSFLTPTQCKPFRARLCVQELLSEMKVCSIDVNLVCVYMVLGNHVQREGIFADLGNFECTDSFLGYCFWYLMKEVFIPAAEDNREYFATYELTLPAQSTLNDTAALSEAYKRLLTKRGEECARRSDDLECLVVASKRDLLQYFFVTCAPHAPYETPMSNADTDEDRVCFEA